MILIIAATKFEIPLFINEEHHHVDILITGVGVPAASYHLQKRLNQIDYDLVIQAGIAGTYTDTILLGETVLVKQDAFGDIGMEEKEKFTTIFKAGFADENEFPFENSWLVNKNKILDTSLLKKVTAVTINKVTDSKMQTQQLIDTFHPDIETMEGAALHYICLQENIPFIQIRSVSNKVGERDKAKWKIKDAVNNLNISLLNMLHNVRSTM